MQHKKKENTQDRCKHTGEEFGIRNTDLLLGFPCVITIMLTPLEMEKRDGLILEMSSTMINNKDQLFPYRHYRLHIYFFKLTWLNDKARIMNTLSQIRNMNTL